MPKINMIAALDAANGIGKDGTIPWNHKEDLRFFKKMTKGKTLIVGRKTYETLPESLINDPYRSFIVVSRLSGENYSSSLEDALEYAMTQPNDVFIIGGSKLYTSALALKTLEFDKIYLTRIDHVYECDTHLEMDLFDYKLVKKEKIDFEHNSWIETYVPQNDEQDYLDLMMHIKTYGTKRDDRTGTGVISSFGHQLKFSLRNNVIPLLTTKRTFWKGIAEELLWFIRGDTNSNYLKDRNIHIWDLNTTREFLDAKSLSHDEGSIGPGYGFQWRHWNATYETMYSDYTDKGIDQLDSIIKKIKETPTDRRLVMSAWNPEQIDQMALPPCHIMCQFYVHTNTQELSLHMYQRSADMFLGVPFNIASYGLLCHIVAKCCDLKPRELTMSFGDAHIYTNHVKQVSEQCNRQAIEFPTLNILTKRDNISDYVIGDLQLENYNPLPGIKAQMSA